jgi:hypothetical protein
MQGNNIIILFIKLFYISCGHLLHRNPAYGFASGLTAAKEYFHFLDNLRMPVRKIVHFSEAFRQIVKLDRRIWVFVCVLLDGLEITLANSL